MGQYWLQYRTRHTREGIIHTPIMTSTAAGLRSRRFMSRRKIRNAFLINKMLLLCKYFSSNRYDVDYLIKKYYIKEESDLQPLKG